MNSMIIHYIMFIQNMLDSATVVGGSVVAIDLDSHISDTNMLFGLLLGN